MENFFSNFFFYLQLEIINRIEAHAGLVKGVAWDPVGVYFASQVYIFFSFLLKHIRIHSL
jgi:hypothetical protein